MHLVAELRVYGIDSVFMNEFDKFGYPVINENSDIYPLTLLVDQSST